MMNAPGDRAGETVRCAGCGERWAPSGAARPSIPVQAAGVVPLCAACRRMCVETVRCVAFDQRALLRQLRRNLVELAWIGVRSGRGSGR